MGFVRCCKENVNLSSEGLREPSQPPSQGFLSEICQGKGKGSGNEVAGKREVEFCDDRKV